MEDLTKPPHQLLVDLINRTMRAGNPKYRPFSDQDLIFGHPQPWVMTDAIMRNTVISVNHVNAPSPQDSRLVYYDRIPLERIFYNQPTTLHILPTSTFDPQDYLYYINTEFGVNLTPSDIDLTVSTIETFPYVGAIKANPNSLIYHGQGLLTLITQTP